MAVLVNVPPCVLHEDDHLLVVNKPPGLNTHASSPHASEGIYDWLRHREPRWARLAILHRLDKATSGILVFGKTRLANVSLTEQFTARAVRKGYLLLASRAPSEKEFVVRSGILRQGEHYVPHPSGESAETLFRFLGEAGGHHLLAAEPGTGRTHQIRVHAQLKQIPIVGDALYGGAPYLRVCLHAREIEFTHPATGNAVKFVCKPQFSHPPAMALREALIERGTTTAFRLLHGAADSSPGIYLERWGEYLLVEKEPGAELPAIDAAASGVYVKNLNRQVRRATVEEAAPRLHSGRPAPEAFTVGENGVKFEISFERGYSVGVFLDQRDNRRRWLTNHVGPDFPVFPEGLEGKQVLNTFAYTCGFSVCAALAGAVTTSLDLSKNYLEWGKRNFLLNDLDPAAHDFIFGDWFEWAPRLARKGREFDAVILDPPTFSHARRGALFQAEKHYGNLVRSVLPLLRSGGILFASTNARRLSPENFLAEIRSALSESGWNVLQEQYAPQPPDFPISSEEPGHLKTVWLRVRRAAVANR